MRREIRSSEWAKELQAPIAEFHRSFGCLVALDTENRSQAKGSGILVALEGRHVVITARHVLTSDRVRTGRLFLLMPRAGADIREGVR
jgi:hypothetical protein